jgi:hypothetical protein
MVKCINDRTVLSTVDVHWWMISNWSNLSIYLRLVIDFCYKFYYSPKFSFSSQNLFLLSILQHVIASKRNHINTMLPNEMVLAPLQKLKIKYELSYQSISHCYCCLCHVNRIHTCNTKHFNWTPVI